MMKASLKKKKKEFNDWTLYPTLFYECIFYHNLRHCKINCSLAATATQGKTPNLGLLFSLFNKSVSGSV